MGPPIAPLEPGSNLFLLYSFYIYFWIRLNPCLSPFYFAGGRSAASTRLRIRPGTIQSGPPRPWLLQVFPLASSTVLTSASGKAVLSSNCFRCSSKFYYDFSRCKLEREEAARRGLNRRSRQIHHNSASAGQASLVFVALAAIWTQKCQWQWVREGLLNVKSVYKVLRMWWEPAKAQELQEIAKITTISNVSMQTGDIIFKTAHRIPLHFHFKQTEPKKNSDYLK